MRKVLLGLLLCFMATGAYAAVQEFPLLRDAAGNPISSCTLSWSEPSGFKLYLGAVGGGETVTPYPNTRALTPPFRWEVPCPVLPVGQYTWTVSETTPGAEGPKAYPIFFNIVDPVVPATITMAFNGMTHDRVGQGNTATAPDGAKDGVMTVTLKGAGGRTITALRLDSSAPGTWDTASSTGFFVLGVASSLTGPLLNTPGTMAVNFPVPDGGTFVLFAADWQNIEFTMGRTLTLVATFSDGSTATASTVISPPVVIGPPPALRFTDLTRGNRTGNGDTSKGLVANQHGAIVTVWGENLGDAQGTSTLTIGGVAPAAIYYWGKAIAPACGPATLHNPYQQMGCVIFQVADTTPLGAQPIMLTTAGGVSPALSFTVTATGAIKYAAVGGGGAGTYASPYNSIQTGIDALERGDVLYVRDGLNIGVAMLGVNSHWGHGDISIPITVTTYPGATSQVGTPTQTGFQILRSGTGYGMTYAKFKVYGDHLAGGNGGQAITLADYGRAIGNWISAPGANAASGGLGAFGSNLFILGNEMTQVGAAGGGGLYHVMYICGRRH